MTIKNQIIKLELEDLISTIRGFKPGKPLDKFIRRVVFPNFKNLAPNSEITFEFPITALVGPNGSGKSSILHALWGMPLRYSTSRFWFSTALDPIVEGGENGISRYYYEHWNNDLGEYVETRKVRARKRDGYWEPARLLESEGMQPLPPITLKNKKYRSNDRWTPVIRKVVYINFKCEFGAFDRFFYFPNSNTTLEKRQELFIKGAERLRTVIEAKRASYKLGGKPSVYENYDLTEKEIGYVSLILGREYISATLVKHRLYAGLETSSVLFKTSKRTYSEAYAGSGELAIVTLVTTLMRAEQFSLVLLDEPETSLHPGAQKLMVAFLLEMIKIKHYQIILSTHSPIIVKKLPIDAIRVIDENDAGSFDIKPASHAQVAFNRLGYTSGSKILLAVEDKLLMTFVELALRLLDKGEREAFEPYIPPGGADSILKYEIPMWVLQKRKAIVILDGDQKRSFPDPESLNERQLETMLVEKKLNPLHLKTGDLRRQYVHWLKNWVFYLDAVCPEAIILQKINDLPTLDDTLSNEQAKEALIKKMEKKGISTNADFINEYPKFLWEIGKEPHPAVTSLNQALKRFLIPLTPTQSSPAACS